MLKRTGVIGVVSLLVVILLSGLSTKSFSQAEYFYVYEDWKDPEIRADRWARGQNDNYAFEVRREIVKGNRLEEKRNRLEMKYRVIGQSATLQNRLSVKKPATITQIEADFRVESLAIINCATYPNNPFTMVVPALIDLALFNDGGSSDPKDATGDYFARVLVRREAASTEPDDMLTAGAYLYRTDTSDGSGITLKKTIDIGKVNVGEKFTLRILWDKTRSEVFVGLNDEDALLSNNVPNVEAAHSPFASIRQRMQLGACSTQIEEEATTQVLEVRTNTSALIP